MIVESSRKLEHQYPSTLKVKYNNIGRPGTKIILNPGSSFLEFRVIVLCHVQQVA